MIWNPFRIISGNFLGIDIGTSCIKIVELSCSGERRKLENYGELKSESFYKKPFRTLEKSTLVLPSQDIARAIKAILEEAKIYTKRAVLAVPDFSTFYTPFELPSMSMEELPEAVRFEARRYIPLSLSEVTLDWQIIEGRPSARDKTKKLKILLVAVPNEVINQYKEITRLAGIELYSLEPEVFGLVKSLVGQNKKVICLVDIGAQSTTVNIVDKGILKLSHSFDVCGNELTRQIAKSMGIGYREAEDLKKRYGLNANLAKDVSQILLPMIDIILTEVEKISKLFYSTERKEVEEIVLAGGAAKMPGLKQYLAKQLNPAKNKIKKQVIIGNPFSDIFYPPILEQVLEEMSPTYAIAVGVALKGLE